jgi:Zn-dependent protease
LAFAAVHAVAAPLVLHALGLFTVMNAALGVFNLIPFYPLDGHFVAYAFLPKRWAAGLKEFYKTSGVLAWVPALVFVGIGMKLGLMPMAAHWLAQLLLGAPGAGAIGL